MKLLLALAFLAAASAAEIKVKPVLLPEAPEPEVYDAPEIQNKEFYDAVKIVDDATPIDDDAVYSVNIVNVAEIPDVAAPIPFEMIDISPMIVPAEIMKQLFENSGNFGDAPVDAVQVVAAPVDALENVDSVQVVAFVDSLQGVDAVQVVDALVDSLQGVDAVQVADAPAEQGFDSENLLYILPDIGFTMFEINVDPVQIVDAEGSSAPKAPFGDVQVDPVVIVDSAQNEMPLEYRRDLPVYADPMLR